MFSLLPTLNLSKGPYRPVVSLPNLPAVLASAEPEVQVVVALVSAKAA